jgi:DNA-binding transcriptional ArsR family regulator
MRTIDSNERDLLRIDRHDAERARERLPSHEELELHASYARALGDPTRLAVALILYARSSTCVSDLAWILGCAEQTASHHVRQLKNAGLALSRREGSLGIYELTELGERLVGAVAWRMGMHAAEQGA